MAGLGDICRNLKTKCPHCGNRLDLSGVGPEVFRRIKEALAQGERVQINNFGTFVTRYIKGRQIQSFDGVVRKMKGRNVIRFSAAPDAKRQVNRKGAPKGEG